MLRRWPLIVFTFLFVALHALAMTPEKVGLYLSFEQRLALSYALLAQGESPQEKEVILERAKSYFVKMAKAPIKTVEVKNFADFLNHHKGSWPETNSLALDIQKIEAQAVPGIVIYKSKSPAVQGQIDRYQAWQREQLINMATSQQSELIKAGLRLGERLGDIAKSATVKKAAQNWLISESEAILSDRMAELDRVGEKIGESGFAKQGDPAMRILMQTIFSEYFSRLSPESKKMIVSSFLGGDLLSNDIKKFELMVQNSGPQLQKLLQVVARQADLPPAVLEVFRGLENSVRPVPWNQVEEILAQEKGNYKFTYFERKPLGVGTMAQVHRAKIEINGQRHDVVVRFIKPDIEKRVDEDRKILQEVALILDENPEFRKTGAPKLAPVVNDITKTVVAELSQEETIERQRLAKERYSQAVLMKTPEYKNVLEFNVPTIYPPEGNKTSAFMVQEMVIGKKLDKTAAEWEATIPGLKLAVVEAMARLWAREVMFGGGFYHSDLHQGNFMLQITEPKIRLHILDFGMGGVISEHLQRQVMVFGIGSELLKADLIARSLYGLSEKGQNSFTEKQFDAMVAAKVTAIKAGKEPALSMEMWTAWAMDLGLKLPYEFVSLNRGISIINKLLKDSGSELDMSQLMKSEATKHPAKVYRALVVVEKIAMRDIALLGWSELKAMMSYRGSPLDAQNVGGLRCEAVFN